MTAPPRTPGIGKTAAWMAAYRALESTRPDRHFDDPLAQRFAEHSELPGPRGYDPAYSMVVQRTVTFDTVIRTLVREQGVDVVVNLACGFDTRPYRLDLPAALHWIEADLPEVIAHKREILGHETPRCRLKSLGVDLVDQAARAGVVAEAERSGARALVITEGLLFYLEPDAAFGLARDLHRSRHIAYWLTDMMSPMARNRMNAMAARELGAAGTRLRFAPREGADVFKPLGWRPTARYASISQMIALKRSPRFVVGTLLRIVHHLAKPSFDGTVLFERSGEMSP